MATPSTSNLDFSDLTGEDGSEGERQSNTQSQSDGKFGRLFFVVE